MMTREMIQAALGGDVLGPSEPAFTVSYWQHFEKETYRGDTVEDCLEFLRHGEDYGTLSTLESCILNNSGDVVMTMKQVQEALDTMPAEDYD